MPDVIQNKPRTLAFVIYRSADGTPITGVFATEISMWLRKEGNESEAKTIDEANFREVDNVNMPGLYEVKFTASDLDTLGTMVAIIPAGVSGTGEEAFNQVVLQLEVVPASTTDTALADIKTLVEGHGTMPSPVEYAGTFLPGETTRLVFKLENNGRPVLDIALDRVRGFLVQNGKPSPVDIVSNIKEINPITAPGYYYVEVPMDSSGEVIVVIEPLILESTGFVQEFPGGGSGPE